MLFNSCVLRVDGHGEDEKKNGVGSGIFHLHLNSIDSCTVLDEVKMDRIMVC